MDAQGKGFALAPLCNFIRFCLKVFSASASCYLLDRSAVLCSGHMQGVKLITIFARLPFLVLPHRVPSFAVHAPHALSKYAHLLLSLFY